MNNKGFTLAEILIVIGIISLLFIFLAPKLSTSSLNSKIDSTEADLRVFSLDLNSYISDYGKLVIDSSLSSGDYKEKAEEFIEILNEEYLNYSFKLDTLKIASDNKSFYINTTIRKDPWNNLYRMYVNTEPNNGVIMVVSPGVDCVFEVDKYVECKFNEIDDILVIIEPK